MSAERTPAVVVGVGWATGVSAIQSLGRAGVPVIAVDERRSALGFRSRYARPVRCPPIAEEERFVAFLAELGESLDGPAPLFPTHDPDLNAIARNRNSLGRFLYPFPAWDVLERIQSKRHQLEEASALGIPVPRMSAEPTGDFGFPVLVKPSQPIGFRAAFGVQAFRAETEEELTEAFERARPYEPIVQEWIPGGDETLYTVGSYVAADGEVLGVFSGRKLRQTPPGVGTCRVGEAVWVGEVVEQGLALLRALGFHGISQVEFKRDPRDGSFKLMEVNPRLWQWHGLASACGVDVPRIAYLDLLGRRPPPVRMGTARKRWAITLKSGTSPVLVRLPYSDPFLSPRDPRLALAHTVRVVRGAIPGLRQKPAVSAGEGENPPSDRLQPLPLGRQVEADE